MASAEYIDDLLAALEEVDAEQLAPPTNPEHGASGAHNSYTTSASESNFGGFDTDIEKQLVKLKEQQQQLMTVSMEKDQGQLLLARKKLEQDNLLKQLILQKNQNQVMNNNPFIQQSQDLAVAQRRFMEAQKYKQDEMTRALQISTMNNEQQYLNSQVYANYHWGIPAVQGLVDQGDDFFTM